jgi:hypothetical protein
MTNSDPNAHTPIGTLTDFEGTEVTVCRDYTTLELPSVQIERDQFDVLRKIIDEAEAAIVACELEMAEDELTDDQDAEVDPAVVGTPFPGRTGYVTGQCGHAVAGSEWRAGFRTCERC